MKFHLLAGAALALASTPVLAQDAAPEGTPPADTSDVIIVLGQGLPDTPAEPAYATIELDRDQLVSSASGRIEDVLSSVAGFQQFRRSDSRSSNPSAQGVTLRALGGNATSRALVLLDGVPVADPFFGFIPLSAIAPERLGTIRVTRGGGSGPFGAGALAGTIEIDSADAATLGFLQGSAMGNFRGETELSGSIAPEVGDGFAVISTRWDRGQGFWTTPEDQRVDASARARVNAISGSARVVQRMGDAELTVRGMAYRDDRTLRFDGADNSSEGQDVSMRLVTRGPWQVDAVGYGQWRNFTNVVISSTRFTRVLDQRDTPSSGVGGKLEVRPPVGGNHTLRFGTDVRRSSGQLFEDAYSAFTGSLTQSRTAGGTNLNYGFFAEDDWQLGDLTLTGGVRADRYRIADGFYRAQNPDGSLERDDQYPVRQDWEVTWRAGALYALGSAARLRAAAYTGFRLPTLNELYRPFVVFPVTTLANEDLLPERLRGYEAGIDLLPADGVTLSLTAFDNKVKDAITNVTIDTNLRQRRNIDAIAAQGLEMAAEIERGPFSLDGTLVLTDAKAVGTGFAAPLDGNRPSQTPEFAASLTASYRPFEGMLLAATLRHVAAQFEDDQESDVLPAATTLDLIGQVPLAAGFSAVARVENAFDEEVVTRNQGGSVDLGAPRTVWLGVRYGF